MTKPDSPELIELIDQLEKVLNDSELSELEIEAGQTGLLLRKPGALSDSAVSAPIADRDSATGSASVSDAVADESAEPKFTGHVIAAPLTGLFYNSPSPGAEPYVREGGEVSIGQVIGLIEAMKLFNEIKSDVTGRVMRIHAESGALVKAKQPLIEVQP